MMVAGFLLLGLIGGFTGATTVLFAGGGWLLALVAYSGIGAFSILFAAALAALRKPEPANPYSATAA